METENKPPACFVDEYREYLKELESLSFWANLQEYKFRINIRVNHGANDVIVATDTDIYGVHICDGLDASVFRHSAEGVKFFRISVVFIE